MNFQCVNGQPEPAAEPTETTPNKHKKSKFSKEFMN